jgi:hypothetical protein
VNGDCSSAKGETNMRYWIIGAAGVWLLCGGAAFGSLVVNGGFETGDLTGWTFIPALSGSLFNVNGPAHTGSYAARFGAVGASDDSILQSLVPTVPGQSYVFDFWLYHPYSDASNDFSAWWDGAPVYSVNPAGSFGWTEITRSVVASSASTSIRFSGRENPAWYYLDDVSVEATIPEPATLIIWSLLGGLAVSIGWWRRRKVA